MIVFLFVKFINFKHRFINLYIIFIKFSILIQYLLIFMLLSYTLKLTNLNLKLIKLAILQKCLKIGYFLRGVQNSVIFLGSPKFYSY